MNETDISLVEVTKIFHTGIVKRKTGVDNLTLSIPRGEIIGLLGANGSGKSTTLKMILGFLRPTRGEILICGKRAGTKESRELLGYLPENPRFQKFLQGRDILQYFGRLHGMSGAALSKRIDELLEMVGLGKAGAERVQGYSKGMTQRLAIAQALLNKPKILIFDEPMSGLDPLGRMEIRSLIGRIHQEMSQTTIFFTTHILSDVEALCSWVALLRKAKLEVFCPIGELLRRDVESYSITAADLPESLRNKYRQQMHASESPLGVTFSLEGTELLMTCLAELRKAGASIVALNSKRLGLEEALFSDKATTSLRQTLAAGGAA